MATALLLSNIVMAAVNALCLYFVPAARVINTIGLVACLVGIVALVVF